MQMVNVNDIFSKMEHWFNYHETFGCIRSQNENWNCNTLSTCLVRL